MRLTTADIDVAGAHRLFDELIENGRVTPVPDQRVLVHEPSGEAFEFNPQLAFFYRGWQAASDVDSENN